MVDKFKKILERITEENGEVILFGILKMDDLSDKWSVVLSASWINEDNRDNSFSYIINLMRENLTKEESDQIARIGILDPSDHLVRALLNFKSEAEIEDRQVNGNIIHKGFILASNIEIAEQSSLFTKKE